MSALAPTLAPVARLSYDLPTVWEITGIKREAIRLAIERGELRRVFVGTKPMILHVDLVAYLESLQETPAK